MSVTQPNTAVGDSDLAAAQQLVAAFMVGDRSSLKRGYCHQNAVIAAADYLLLQHQPPLTDRAQSLLACFALGFARGLGSATATLQALNSLHGDLNSEDAVEAYHAGMFRGHCAARTGDTYPDG